MHRALIDALRDPEAYPHPADDITVVQTHASVVFLAGEHAYKIKKPVDLGFLDYSSFERRLLMCRAEVQLNRRLAPDVYLGVVPIVVDRGRIRIGGNGSGAVIEYAVHMVRLPDEARLDSMLAAGEVTPGHMARLGRVLAEFHANAARGPEVSALARFEVVATNCRDNLEALASGVGRICSASVLERLRIRTEAELARRRDCIQLRAEGDRARDTHGDLRLEHVYFLSDALKIVDCIEFSERFRYADPVCDVAFLVMDLRAHGAWDLAEQLEEAYFAQAGDPDGRSLMPLYTSYRSAVRAKVRAMQAEAAELTESERCEALQRARGHALLALGELSSPDERPCLLLVAGLPGTGKSAVARELEAVAGFDWVSSDIVRKRLAGLSPTEPSPSQARAGIYTPAWNDRTYGACLERAEQLLFEGRRVIVDASFKQADRRQVFIDLGRRLGVPVHVMVCEVSPELAKARLDERVGDPSDADWTIYRHVEATWEPFDARTEALVLHLPTDGSLPEVTTRATAALRTVGLFARGCERTAARGSSPEDAQGRADERG